ncbi:MAG: hypothetical protein HC772_03415 [Leptolyngbyaceae cyanobacterium CRU_2_3]|nr:hypothetical protein [Leptolyngbyaceae cyanobacterium CRU_2_3]
MVDIPAFQTCLVLSFNLLPSWQAIPIDLRSISATGRANSVPFNIS